MAENVPGQIGKQFVGNKQTNEVHDLNTGKCSVDPEVAVEFNDLDEAYAARFNNCPKCLGGLFINPISYVTMAGGARGSGAQGPVIIAKEGPRPPVTKIIKGPPETK